MSEANPSGAAVGWSMFAATMLFVIGGLEFLAGLSAAVHGSYYVVGTNYLYKFNVATWGWINMLVGVIVVGSGFGVLKGHVLGRTVGVFIAAGSIVANFLWLPYSPVWSSILIAIGVAVIWALTAHGRDITAID